MVELTLAVVKCSTSPPAIAPAAPQGRRGVQGCPPGSCLGLPGYQGRTLCMCFGLPGECLKPWQLPWATRKPGETAMPQGAQRRKAPRPMETREPCKSIKKNKANKRYAKQTSDRTKTKITTSQSLKKKYTLDKKIL